MNDMTVIPRPNQENSGVRALSLEDIADREGEPRVRDIDLAERLGFRKSLNIRETITRNRKELSAYGEVSAAVAETSKAGGRPGKEYWLNEGQALVICALSRTTKAAAIRKQIIDVFMAYRAGRLAPSVEAATAAHDPATLDDIRVQLAMIGGRIDILGVLTSRLGEALVPELNGFYREMLTAADSGAAALAAATLAKPADRSSVSADAQPGSVERVAAAPPRTVPPANRKRGRAQPTSGPDLLYGMPAIAEYLQLRKGQAYHLAEKGGLPVFRLGRIVCATRASIDQWVAASAQRPEVRS